ncbi:testicular haploid expressed gene protein-like isoform X2 [Hemicordylus capensis]|uniref:testicular haploid expressed gene protein-like isoform X2 n=1 Tax=Hemicordylus capensis TaxID=884348 RepID=UPI0023041879|nr:testicular haploid expressed gene protein-like isoform X2 [Hemicordylus capensis]
MTRLQELAKPKKEKDVWNFTRKLIWGNQDPIWPVASRALMSQPSIRTLLLAKPKRNFDGNIQRRPLYVYSCGRESELWERPPRLYSVVPSERILQLAEPRQLSSTYLQQRPRSYPAWPISFSALCCKASQRVLDLAQPRPLNPSVTLPKEAETHVKRSTLNAVASQRTQHLAQPVMKKASVGYENRYLEAPIRQVSLAAQQAVATPRILELAKAKMLHTMTFPDRPAEWPVSLAARHAVASPRLEALAQPPKRAPTNFVQFNPEAFTVKESAKRAFCSNRIKALAQPISH